MEKFWVRKNYSFLLFGNKANEEEYVKVDMVEYLIGG